MALTEEVFNTLPDEVKTDYELHDGVYVTIDSLKVSGLKESLNNLDGKMKSGEAAQAKAIQEAKETARNEAIAEAQKSQNWEEQERLMREKFDDELKRARDEERGNVTKEFTVKQSQDSLANDVKLIASELAVDDLAKPALEIMIKQRTKLDENGNRVYLGDDGSALSITDLKAFKEEFAKSPTVARLVKGKSVTTGNGLANGSGFNAGGAGNINAKAEKAKQNRDGVGLLNARLNEHFNK